MKDHWEKIGYQPDTGTLNEVDEELELEVQVGKKDTETNYVPESTMTSKYNSVIVKGFRTDTPLESILDILHQYGLPEVYITESIVRNENTGSITLENLKPEECLSLTSRMHKKMFLRRQIFVTSVVGNSPGKPPAQKSPVIEITSDTANHEPPNLGNTLLLIPTPITPNSGSVSPTSPKVQEKIDQIEKQTSSKSLTGSDSSSRKKSVDKRKSESSPESDLSRKEKKMLRGEEKKQDKMRKKLEFRDKNTIQGQINHSY